MAFVLKDRVKETTTTTGTGTVTLAGAVTGFDAFSVVGDGNTTYYAIVSQAPGEWEVGIGTYTSSGTTLARDTVLASSNSGSAVNFSAGTKDVFVTYPAGSAVVASDNPGSSGQVLTSNGTGVAPTWEDAGGGGGALTISNKTAAYTVVAGDLGTIINCTSGTFTVSLTAAATLGAGFNCWVWNTGTGAITIDPNGTETVDGVDPTTEFKIGQGTGVQLVCTGTAWLTGDTRNSGAASIGVLGTQIGRNSAGNMSVATSGQGSVALGGSYASGTDSFAAAIANNTSSYGATGAYSVAIGRLAKATGSSSYAFGSSSTGNLASGNNSFARGVGCTASNTSSVAMGSTCTSSGFASVVMGSDGNDNGVQYRRVYGSNAGVQNSDFILWDDTTDATPTVISTNGNAAGISAATQLSLPNNSAYAFSGIIVARQQAAGGTASAAWKVEGLIRREGSAGTTVLVNSATTVIDNTPGWTLALSADTTNGGLAVTATGAAATNIRWVATIQTSEVTYA